MLHDLKNKGNFRIWTPFSWNHIYTYI